MKLRLIALLAVVALVAAACGGDDAGDDTTTTTAAPTTTTTMVEEEMMSATVVDVAVDGGFTTLVTAVQAAGLVDTLSGDGPFTVFAPTDDAFAALPEGTLDALLADPEALAAVLTYHVVPGKVLAADVVGLSAATTVQGEDIAIEVVEGTVVLNDGATVTATDIEASNGVVHVIDQVILPPSMSEAEAEPMLPSLVETAVADGRFTTLLAALEAAGLAESLNSGALGKLTVFAPTDEAFEALPEGTVEGLLADPEALAGVLTYHVTLGEVLAADVVELESYASLAAGAPVSIAVVDGGVVLNDSVNVIETDIITSGGIIHVLDGVLIPPSS